MKRNAGVLAVVVGVLLSAWCGGAWGNSVTISLVNPGSAAVTSGTPFELRVVANITDARLSATAYTLSVTTSSGDARAWLNRRSADPNEANGLTYISQTVQFPFENNLAHNFRAGGQAEVMADMDYGDEPGGELDGIEPNTGVVLERIAITPTGTGSLTISLSNFTAVTTETDPNGQFFDTMTIDGNQVFVTVGGTAHYWLQTRVDPEESGEIVLTPPTDPCVPVYSDQTDVTLNGDKTTHKPFRHWTIFDPNYPGDANVATQDSNNPIVLRMASDQEVEAYFDCSSGLGPMLPGIMSLLGVAWLTRRMGVPRTQKVAKRSPSEGRPEV